MDKLEVKLTTQSFGEAGGKKVFPELEIGGIVQVVTYNNENTFDFIIEKALKELKIKAKEKGFTHIFGIEYRPYIHPHKHSSYGQDYLVIGTGYK